MDFSVYKMSDYNWIKTYQDKLGKITFNAFVDKVYGILDRVKEGQSFDISADISITDRNRDLFIKVACMYIADGNENYSFSEDHTIISRIACKSTKQEHIQLLEVANALEKKRKRKYSIAE